MSVCFFASPGVTIATLRSLLFRTSPATRWMSFSETASIFSMTSLRLDEPAVAHEVFADPHHLVAGALEPDAKLADGVILRAAQLARADRLVLELRDLAQDQLDRLGNPVAVHAGLDVQHAGLVEKLDAAVNGIGQPVLLANHLEQPRAHVLAEDDAQQLERVAAAVVPAEQADAQRDMRLLDVLGENDARPSARVCFVTRGYAGFLGLADMPQQFRDTLHAGVVVHLARRTRRPCCRQRTWCS